MIKIKSLVSLFIFVFFLNSCAQENNQKPNILFIMMDDAGLDMSIYGSTYVNTPGFDEIAKQGVLFNRAYTPNAKCAPSRSMVMTGRYSWQLDAAANHFIYFPPKFKTYQETLLENGYTTGHTGKGYMPGKTLTEDGSKRDVMGASFNKRKLNPPTTGIADNDYHGNFVDFLDKAEKDKPWSFWVGSLEPHRGYEYGTGAKLGGKTPDMITDFPKYWPDNQYTRNDLLDYAFEIEYIDGHVQKIMQTLRDRNLIKNTLIILTSDHGMPFPRVKGDQYEHANHVPMAMLWEGKMISKGRVIEDFVSFIDLAPTILEAAGIDWQTSGMFPATGKSIMNMIASDKSGQIEPERNYVLVGKERHDTGRPDDVGYPIRGIYKDSMLYLKNYEIDRWPSGNPETGYLNSDASPTKTAILNMRRNGEDKYYWKLNFGKRVSEELYNIKQDPYCMDNLANNKKLSTLKLALKMEMETKLTEQNDLRMKGYGHLYEKHPLSGGKNFYDDFMAGKKPIAGWVIESDFEPVYVDGNGNTLGKVVIPSIKN